MKKLSFLIGRRLVSHISPVKIIADKEFQGGAIYDYVNKIIKVGNTVIMTEYLHVYQKRYLMQFYMTSK